MISTVYIAKNVYGGDGLGRLGDGRVVFVEGAFAGENVKAEIVEEKRHFVRARLVEVVEPSADRLTDAGAKVPGMVYANLAYAAERRTKLEQLVEFFDRARIPTGSGVEALGEGLPFLNYRNKVVYHFARRGGDWVIGYRQEPSHEIIDVMEDPLAVKPINDALAAIRGDVKRLLTQGPVAVRREVEAKGKLTIRYSERSGVKWWVGEPPAALVLRERTLGRVYEVPADGFYQVNPFAGELLVETVAAAFGKVATSDADVLDLYCGVGVFALSSGAKRVFGVESGRQAIDFARRNAALRKDVKADFLSAEVGRCLKKLVIGPQTVVIADPPRGGMERGVAEFLAKSRAPRIFYVSCDPATLVRDLKELTRAYAVSGVKLIDMFPRTARFETLVELVRRENPS